MNERGSVTAEFAAAVPAVIVVLVSCLAGVQAAGQQVRLQDAAAIAARSTARGESEASALDRARHLAPGARLGATSPGDLECATLAQRALGPAGLLHLTLRARSCALAGGQ
ncbi:hypothetical protein BH11ACT2_BH11ACT2_03640 [soil metagenome]